MLSTSISSIRPTRAREIFACMELPIMFECVLDYGVIAAKFLPNSIVRPAKINKLEDSPTFRGVSGLFEPVGIVKTIKKCCIMMC